MLQSSVGVDGVAFGFGATGTPAITALQRALVSLARVTGDSILGAGGTDGLLGRKTRIAVNRAVIKYLPNAPANLRTGRLSYNDIRANAAVLTGLVGNETQRREGAAGSVAPSAPVAAQRPTSRSNAAVARLQQALITIGQLVKDPRLNIAPDGILGPKTAAAVNRAFTRYVVDSPSRYKTGRLTVANVLGMVATLVQLAEAEVARRQSAPAPTTAPVPVASRAAVQRLQRGLRALADVTKDRSLYVAVDGRVGPGTTSAVNRALQKFVHEAPVQWRTGKLTVTAVRANAAALIPHIETAVARLQKEAAKKPPPDEVAPPPELPKVAKPAREAVTQLQRTIYALGQALKDSRLKIADDGVVGPNTATAVNYLFTKYITAGEAPEQYRTGRLTLASIAGAVDALTGYVQQELQRTTDDIQRAKDDEVQAAELERLRKEAEAKQREAVAKDTVPTTPTPGTPAAIPGTVVAPPPGVGPAVPGTVAPPPAPYIDDPEPTRFPAGEEPWRQRQPGVPAPSVAPPVKKPFPTLWVVGIGGGVMAAGLLIYLAWGGKNTSKVQPRRDAQAGERPRPRARPQRKRKPRRRRIAARSQPKAA